jgi:hypothetical protein
VGEEELRVELWRGRVRAVGKEAVTGAASSAEDGRGRDGGGGHRGGATSRAMDDTKGTKG